MLLDVLLLMLVVICFFSGRKREMTLEFFEVFKYLLIIFLMNYTYPLVGKIMKIDFQNSREQLKIYIITFLILYVAFSIFIKISGKFLKSIKLGKWDKGLGGILGIIKSTFIIFIIYIIVLIGSNYSKKIKTQRDSSKIIKGITEYGYVYTEMFPEFIKYDIESFRVKRKKDKLKKQILKEFKEKNINKG